MWLLWCTLFLAADAFKNPYVFDIRNPADGCKPSVGYSGADCGCLTILKCSYSEKCVKSGNMTHPIYQCCNNDKKCRRGQDIDLNEEDPEYYYYEEDVNVKNGDNDGYKTDLDFIDELDDSEIDQEEEKKIKAYEEKKKKEEERKKRLDERKNPGKYPTTPKPTPTTTKAPELDDNEYEAKNKKDDGDDDDYW